jgi:hypothetical protein
MTHRRATFDRFRINPKTSEEIEVRNDVAVSLALRALVVLLVAVSPALAQTRGGTTRVGTLPHGCLPSAPCARRHRHAVDEDATKAKTARRRASDKQHRDLEGVADVTPCR